MIGYGVVAGVVGALYLVLVVFKRKGGDKIDHGRRSGLRRKIGGAWGGNGPVWLSREGEERGGMGRVNFTIILSACMALVGIGFYFENQRFVYWWRKGGDGDILRI
jgi:hypothetical protein